MKIHLFDIQRLFIEHAPSAEEIDFVVTENQSPILAIECMLLRAPHSSFIRTFAARFPQCRMLQLTLEDFDTRISAEGIETLSARRFLKELI